MRELACSLGGEEVARQTVLIKWAYLDRWYIVRPYRLGGSPNGVLLVSVTRLRQQGTGQGDQSQRQGSWRVDRGQQV